MSEASLQPQLRAVRRRVLLFGSASATAWGLATAVLLLLGAVWFDLLWELSPQWRIGALCVAAVAALALVCILVGKSLIAGRDASVARRLDRAAGYGGDVLTGFELQQSPPESEPGRGMANMAVGHAVSLAGRVPRGKAVSAKPLGQALAAFIAIMAVVSLLAVCLPGLARTQWDRFTNPTADVPPFSQTTFKVEPGDVDVVYGDELSIHAEALGTPVEQLELVIEHIPGSEESLPMFPEANGHWRAVLAKVTESGSYYVRSHRARSRRFDIRLITVPRIESVSLSITQPAYANRPPYRGLLPEDGIVGLPGTTVCITAGSNRPLSGGLIAVNSTVGDVANVVEAEMQPLSTDGSEVTGQFTVGGDGKFELKLIDVAGQSSRESFSGTITMLADQRPFIRLTQPRKKSLATPTTTLPVEILAEDDCGISTVELYRCLNDSRPRPARLEIDDVPPRRSRNLLQLPLAGYGLQPGDVLKFFGRVEDNDPAGAKGSESSLVTVEIISQEEFERMVRVREGLKVLSSKYREARRRMEALAKEAEGLRKKLKDQPPENEISKETRRQLERTLKRLRKESEALKRLSKHKLPYDLDNNLAPQLEDLAKMTDEMADALEKLLKESELHNDKVRRQLKKMTSRLADQRKKFDQNVTMPMEMLEAVFPLVADQSRFVMLVMRQIDLAERLASLKGRDGEDDPALKTRMRDLEEEQRAIREDLGKLLGDIENHAQRLPDDPSLDKLRETALKFVADVRGSGASRAMSEAEAALADFSGTEAHAKAQEAAEILKKFLKQCQGAQGMGQMAGQSLIFQPGLGNSLGNTVAQLLAEMGLSQGSGGAGAGQGGSGGFSAKRGYGLYGGMPGMPAMFGDDASSGGGQGDDPAGEYSPNDFAGRNPDETNTDSGHDSSAAGVGENAVPLRYRRRVGEYFRRVNEETLD